MAENWPRGTPVRHHKGWSGVTSSAPDQHGNVWFKWDDLPDDHPSHERLLDLARAAPAGTHLIDDLSQIDLEEAIAAQKLGNQP